MGGAPILQWRKFEFFDLTEEADNGILKTLLKNVNTPTCACSGRGLLYVGDSAGFVHCLGRTLHSAVPSFPAHDAPLSWLWAADGASMLVTMAHLSHGGSELKVWAPDRLHEDQPVLLRLLRPDPRPPLPRSGAGQSTSASTPPQVTAVAVHPNLNMLVLGFNGGAIMLYRGDLFKDRERSSTSRVLVTLTSSITNLHFLLSTHTYSAHTPSRGRKAGAPVPAVNVQTTSLIVTTLNNVYNIACTHRDKETTTEVDSVGCESGCSALGDSRSDHHQFMIARDDALYNYTSEGCAGFYAFPGPKLRLYCHRGYALVISPVGGDPAAPKSSAKAVCNVYDLSNKVNALTCTLPGPVLGLAGEWGALYIIHGKAGGTGAAMLQCKEKDLHTKMEILFKKNQYDIAVSLAKGQSVSGEGVAEILKQYGDWLYSKGDLAMAVRQYIKTIPYLEPSYVIKKFLSSEHTPLLAQYLEELHSTNLHSPDHSSLLLNCYTRNRHESRIHSFIQKHSEQVLQARKQKENQLMTGGISRRLSSTATLTSGVGFSAGDVEVLVAVCREGGFYKEALQLTALHGLHALHLDVLCNDTKQYCDAVRYIRSLPFSAACEQAVLRGAELTRGCREEALTLLIDLATGYMPDNTPLVGEQAPLDAYLSSAEPESAPPEMFEGVVCGDGLLTVQYVEGVTKRLRQLGRQPPAPRLYGMLLAEYLQQRGTADDEVTREAWEHKVRILITEVDRCPVDPSLACLLCDRHDFPEGKLLIWQQHDMIGEILQYHMSCGSTSLLVEVCKQQEERGKPAWWLTALRLLTAPHLSAAPDTVALQTVLDKVDGHDLLPPMEIIELLSACPHITLGQVGDYLSRLADREETATKAEQEVVEQQVAKSAEVRALIEDIQNNGLVFTESICNACQKELEFPTVHFFCKHSFHQHCFASYCSSSEDECPVCLPRHNEVRDALRNQAQDRASVISFGNSPTSSGGVMDVFSELSEYLSRGLFTDYSSMLAAQSAMLSTPSARADTGTSEPQTKTESAQDNTPEAARRQKITAAAAAAALEPPNASHIVSESRLRLKEARPRSPVPAPASEGRLRQVPPRSSTPQLFAASVGEGRLRGQEASRDPVSKDSSEGRVRQQQQQPRTALDGATEGRVRGVVASNITESQSEARLRTQGRKFGGHGLASSTGSPPMARSPYQPSSLHDQITVPALHSIPVRSPEQQAKGRHAGAIESISASVANSKSKPRPDTEQNPFEKESNNPFDEDFETEDMENTLFVDDTIDDTNPFSEDIKEELNSAETKADYDKNLNPFGE